MIQKFIVSDLGRQCRAVLIDSEEISNEMEREEELEIVVVKSLVWICDEEPILVVLHYDLNVDKILLASYLNISNVQKCKLASITLAEEYTGCQIGTIPSIPLLHPMKVIIDSNLIETCQDKGLEYIYSGSSISGKALKLHLKSLIQSFPNVNVTSISCHGHGSKDRIPSVESLLSSSLSSSLSKSKTSVFPKKKVNSMNQSNVSVETKKNNKITSFPYSTLRRLAATSDTEKFSQILEIFDSLHHSSVHKLDIDDPTGSGKTALQLAAWKGPIQHIRMLLERGADMNKWSTNIGNYGKTAIFYAITRCRDDVVMELISRSAWIKIVNNKGQSPRSLAVSHLEQETLEAIEKAETEQRDLPWLNFRESHSDGGLYGDLDPRFLESSTLKYVLTQTQHYDYSSLLQTNLPVESMILLSNETKESVLKDIKSIFPTTFEMRYTNQLRDSGTYLENDMFSSLSASSAILLPPEEKEEADEDVGGKNKENKIKVDGFGEVILPSKQEKDIDNLLKLPSLSRLILIDKNHRPESIQESHSIFQTENDSNGLITLHGTILSKRHVGKLLVFANMIPYHQDEQILQSPIFNYPTVTSNHLTKLSWLIKDKLSDEVITNTPIALQLLVGKTMFKKYGEEMTRSICRCIAPGQTVLVTGTFSAVDDTDNILMNRLRYGNTSLDFIVHDYKIVGNETKFKVKSVGRQEHISIDDNINDYHHGYRNIDNNSNDMDDSNNVISSNTNQIIETIPKRKKNSEKNAINSSFSSATSSNASFVLEIINKIIRNSIHEHKTNHTESIKHYHTIQIQSTFHFRNINKLMDDLTINSTNNINRDNISSPITLSDSIVASKVYLIDDMESVRHLQNEFQRIVASHDENKDIESNILVGIDCEWRPAREAGVDYPVALLQMAIKDEIFLIDLLSMLSTPSFQSLDHNQSNDRNMNNQENILISDISSTMDIVVKDDRVVETFPTSSTTTSAATAVICSVKSLNEIESNLVVESRMELSQLLDNALRIIFHHKDTIIIGFGLNTDLRKLFQSYPVISCFYWFPSCLDLNTVMIKLNDSIFSSSKKDRSLSKLSNEILGKYLNKSQQCSAWHERPLLWDQIEYASLDAIVLLKIYDKLVDKYIISLQKNENEPIIRDDDNDDSSNGVNMERMNEDSKKKSRKDSNYYHSVIKSCIYAWKGNTSRG